MGDHHVWSISDRYDNWGGTVKVPFPFEDFLFNPGKSGIDLHSHYGRTLGGSVDLSWTIGRTLDLWIAPHMVSEKREAFDIAEWAVRKESQAPSLVLSAIINLLDAGLFRYVYPKMGRMMYEDPKFYAAVIAAKGIVNSTIVWKNWDILKENDSEPESIYNA
uniref:Uncharacterized protein n=1 Tax=viral metagenome TaxID=1070528 RepID=A0A2V0RBZ0_9ZZZZ